MDRCNKNEKIFRFFDELLGSAFYSDQFRQGEVCSRINGSHLSLLVTNVLHLVNLARNQYQRTNYLNNLCEMFLLLLRMHEFSKKVKIESRELYLKEIDRYKIDIELFYDYGGKFIIANNTAGDGEIFYLHMVKHYVPRIACETLEMFNCSI